MAPHTIGALGVLALFAMLFFRVPVWIALTLVGFVGNSIMGGVTPTFALADDEMEMGVGIHGEPGRARVKLAGADAIADLMLTAILNDRGNPNSGDVLLLVNGFGGTPAIELYLMYNVARRILEKRGLTVTRSLVGSYVTSLEMAGCSITVTQLDDKLTALWDDRVHTAALRW